MHAYSKTNLMHTAPVHDILGWHLAAIGTGVFWGLHKY